jgi:hypothetical protein
MDNTEPPSEPAVAAAAPVDPPAPSTDAAEAAPTPGDGALSAAADDALASAAPPPAAAAAAAEDGKAGGAAGEVSYSSPSMAAARALFAAPKASPAPAPSPRREGPSAAALKFGGGGAKAKADDAAAAAAAAAAEPAGPPVTVYHKGAYYPLAELVAATRQNPGNFAGIDFNEKELMLNEEGFKAVFGMSHEEFLQLGKWKRDQKKKEKGMF